MQETGVIRFPGSLDPRAQEFRPRNPTNPNPGTTVFRPPSHHLYYQYATPYPTISEVQVLPFCDGGLTVAYPQFPLPPTYVSPAGVSVIPPVQPPPSVATRSLLLSSVPSDVSESTVRRELEAFGEVRGVQMDRVSDGIVTVHFYDLRYAERALREIREQHMQQQTRLRDYYNALLIRNSGVQLPCDDVPPPLPPPARGLIAGRAVWAQYVLPPSNAVPEGRNQGTIVVFNLDSEISSYRLREIFEAFGPVKELRDTPFKKQQRFVEFFDVRDAAKALKEMNGKEIYGKPVGIEFSRPGGHSKKFFNFISTAPAICSNTYYPGNPMYSAAQPPPPPPPPPKKFLYRPTSNVPTRSFHSQSQFSPTKRFSRSEPSPNRSNFNSHFDSGDLEANMASLNLDDDQAAGTRVEEREISGSLRRNSKKNNIQSIVTMKQHQPQPSKIRPRKGRQSKKMDSRFLINEDGMVESDCRDSRTTVMIKNIPNKYSQKLLLNMLDNHCIHCNEQIADGDDQPLSSYDFVYLPIDFNNKCNVGYGFVNMTTPEATLRLYKAFHLQHWEVFNSRKICEVTYARVQGLEGLKEHFKNSKFPCEIDHYLPVVFSPPRDGRQLTEPLPIVGQKQSDHHHHPIGDDLALSSPTASQPVDHDNDEMDGPDTQENPKDVSVADHRDLLIGCRSSNSSCNNSSSSSNNGGAVGDDYVNDQNM